MFFLKSSSGYTVRITREPHEIEAAQRLRYEIFNLELGEGLASSHTSGLDADPYDSQCDHLIVEEAFGGTIVGTYRLQTGEMARAGRGYYSAQEFDFTPYEPLRPQVLELGRACIHQNHRRRSVLDLLWRAIAGYASQHDSRYLLGCSSLTSQDPAEGWSVYRQLESAHLAEAALRTVPLPAYQLAAEEAPGKKGKIPKLFATYLSVGAVIAGPPAIDREFQTIDFLTLLDLQKTSAAGKKHFLHEHG